MTSPDLHDLELLLRSDTPLVLIEPIEEPRVIELGRPPAHPQRHPS